MRDSQRLAVLKHIQAAGARAWIPRGCRWYARLAAARLDGAWEWSRRRAGSSVAPEGHRAVRRRCFTSPCRTRARLGIGLKRLGSSKFVA